MHKGHQGSCDVYGAAPRPHATTVQCNCHYSGDNVSPRRTGDGYSMPQPLAAQGNTWSGPCNGGRPARGAPCTTRRLQCCCEGLRSYEHPPPRSTRPRASSYCLYNPLGAHCTPGRGFKPASWSSNLQHEVFSRNELNFDSTPCIDHLYTTSLCYPFPETHTVSGRVDAWSPPLQRVDFALNNDTTSSCSSTADMGVHHPMRRLPATHKVNAKGTWPILRSPPLRRDEITPGINQAGLATTNESSTRLPIRQRRLLSALHMHATSHERATKTTPGFEACPPAEDERLGCRRCTNTALTWTGGVPYMRNSMRALGNTTLRGTTMVPKPTERPTTRPQRHASPMYSSAGTIQGPGYGSQPRAMSHKLRTHGLETTSEPTGSMSYSGTTPAGTLRESTPSYTRPTNSPVSLQLSGGAQLRAQRGPKPLLDGHTSSTDSNLHTVAIYDGTPCTSHINFLVTLQGPDDPTPRTIESLQLSTNESMSDFDDSTANGSPCPSPGHNCFTGSPTTSGCKATQVWGSQKLFPDGHSSNLPTTSSEEFPCSSIGSASNVEACLRWNLTTSDMGVTDSGAANVLRERCGRHRCIPRKAPLTIPPHQEPNFGMTSAVPLVEASDKLGGYSIASTGYHKHSVQRMRNDTKVTRTCTAGMSGNSSRTLMPLNGSTPATKRCWHNGSNSAKLHREGPNPPAAENTCAKTMAADQKTITVFPKVIQPSGGGGNPRVTIHKNQPHHSQLPETSGNVNAHEDSPKGHNPFGKSTSNIAYGLLSETSSGNTPYSLDIAHSALNVPTANTNYVQGDSYAIEQQLAAQKAVTPTHCQNGKDITLLLWMVHKPVLPAANVTCDMTRYDKSHAHQKCVPGMSKSQEKGKQHHVTSDPKDPNDEVQSVTL